MMKRVMDLAVPGKVVCMANNLCIAVLVKNPNIIIKLMDPVCWEQYWATAIKFLQPHQQKFFITRLLIQIRLQEYQIPLLFIVFVQDEVIKDWQGYVDDEIGKHVLPY